MDSAGYFLALAEQVGFGLTAFWPITVLLAIAWVGAFAATKPGPAGGRWRTLALGCLAPFALPVAILVCGVVFASREGEPPTFPQYIIAALLLAHLPLAGLHCWWWGERCLSVLVSWVSAGYVSLAAGFISGMSVTGVWL